MHRIAFPVVSDWYQLRHRVRASRSSQAAPAVTEAVPPSVARRRRESSRRRSPLRCRAERSPGCRVPVSALCRRTDRVDPMDAARAEVLHREVVLALHHADHAQRVGKVGVLVDRTLDQEPVTFEPLVGGPPANHRVLDHRVGHLDRPLADQRLERLQLRPGVGLVHLHLLHSRFRGILPCRYLRSAARS